MHGDDEPLNELRRLLQEQTSKLLEVSARVTALESRLISLSEMIEESRLH